MSARPGLGKVLCVGVGGATLRTHTLLGRPTQGRGHLGAVDLTSVLSSGPNEPEEKPAFGELTPEGRGREGGVDPGDRFREGA